MKRGWKLVLIGVSVVVGFTILATIYDVVVSDKRQLKDEDLAKVVALVKKGRTNSVEVTRLLGDPDKSYRAQTQFQSDQSVAALLVNDYRQIGALFEYDKLVGEVLLAMHIYNPKYIASSQYRGLTYAEAMKLNNGVGTALTLTVGGQTTKYRLLATATPNFLGGAAPIQLYLGFKPSPDGKILDTDTVQLLSYR